MKEDEKIKRMMVEGMEHNLRHQILPFWSKLKDLEYGGYYGLMDNQKRIDVSSDKGVILHSRILWFFSNCYALTKDPSLLEDAKTAYLFLRDYGMDPINKGVYWSVTNKGKPKDTTKHTYNLAFCIYGLCAYYQVSKDKEVFNYALDLYETIESKCKDQNGYLEAFDLTFKPLVNDKLSENGVIAQRTMNTLLHVFEAYTLFYQVLKDEVKNKNWFKEKEEVELRAKKAQVREALEWMLELFERKIYQPLRKRQEVFFDLDYNSLIDLHSYGHDIETAWLIDLGLFVLEDYKREKEIKKITRILTNNVWLKAFDGHSLANESENEVVDETRIWWVQAEAVVGFYHGYEEAKKERTEEAKQQGETYLRSSEAIWHFIQQYIIDPYGDWYYQVSKVGEQDTTKPMVSEWKCPYHSGRMCLEMIRRVRHVT